MNPVVNAEFEKQAMNDPELLERIKTEFLTEI